MACSFCRKRKLRCNGNRPSCANCVRVSNDCEYDPASLSRARKRRSRIEANEVSVPEAYEPQSDDALSRPGSSHFLGAVDVFALYNSSSDGLDLNRVDTTPDESDSPSTPFGYNGSDISFNQDGGQLDLDHGQISAHSFAGLAHGHSEPRLTENMKAELTELFFRDVYPSIPILHKSRYYASLSLAPQLQPPLCLRYAIWALAAIQNQKWSHLANDLYENARTYLEQDEFRFTGTEVLNVAHVQTWTLIATYESYMLLSLRTWSSIRRAAALANLLRLHSVDESDEPASPLLPETQDPQELEERRRAFWSAFSSDRWISTTTGYPMTMPDAKITTKLPSSESSFNSGLVEQTQSLYDALETGLDPKASVYGARAVLACVLGRVMRHVESAATPNKIGGAQQFWTQHTQLDSLLTRVSSSRSAELRPSSSTTDPKLWAIDLWLHGLSICLHQTAVDLAMQHKDRGRFSTSLSRCRDAADHIVSSIRSIAHIESRKMDPFTASCVYMAARVLIQAPKYGVHRNTDIEDLRYLQQVLQLMHKHWKVTGVFITQFNDDLANSGINLLSIPTSGSGKSSRKRIGHVMLNDGKALTEGYISDDFTV